MKKVLALALWSCLGMAVTLPDLPNSAALAPIVAEMGYSLPSCPTPGPTAAPGGVPSPITTAAHLTTAAAAATNGDVICIGANITGKFTFNTANTSFVTIRQDNSVASRRALSSDTPRKITSPDSGAAITFGASAKRYRLVGLDITTSLASYTGALIKIGAEGPNSSCELIDIDRNVIHGMAGYTTAWANTGVQLYNCKSVAVQQNYIYDIRGGNQAGGNSDTNGILGLLTPGPVVLENNYVEASGENIMFGGGKLYTVASDLIIRGNLLEKITSQRGNNGRYLTKNLLEFKQANRVLVEGNTFRNFWGSSATSQYYAIVIKSSSNCKEGYQIAHSSNITIRYNKFDQISEGFTLGKMHAPCPATGPDAGHEALGGNTFHIHNNLFTGFGQWVPADEWSGKFATMFQVTLPKPPTGQNRVTASNITLENNTVGSFGVTLAAEVPKLRWGSACQDVSGWCLHDGFTFRNNVMSGKFYPQNTINPVTSEQWSAYFTNSLATKNLGPGTQAGVLTAPNYSITGAYDTIFTNAASGDYTLTGSYALLTGTDGNPLGADISDLDSCTAGSLTDWSGTCPSQANIGVDLMADGSNGPIEVASGASVTLSWTVSNSSSCTKSSSPSGWSGSAATPTGTATVNPTVNTVYTLTCTGSAPTRADSVTVNITTADAPGTFTNVSPTNGNVDESLTPTLTWQGSTGAETYDVYLDACASHNPPTTVVSNDQTAVTYTSGALSTSTLYCWRVVATNSAGSTAGDTWTFTTIGASLTAPDTPTYVAPANSATGVTRPVMLQWNAAARASTYDIYVGVSNPPDLFISDYSGISRLFSTLEPSTLYYWKIVAKNAAGSTAGTVRSFTTAAPPTGCPSVP